MPIFIVPVSGGVDSANVLLKAMNLNSTVFPIFIAVNSAPSLCVADLTAAEKVVSYFKKNQNKYPGKIRDLSYALTSTLELRKSTPHHVLDTPASYSVIQQFNLVYNTAKFRAKIWEDNPTVLLGWLKADASETSFNEYDFSEQEYKELLELPMTLGKLSNTDRTCKPFRVPLWEKSKSEIYSELPDELKNLVIPNGFDRIGDTNEQKLIRIPGGSKIKEWSDAGIPVKDGYPFSQGELSLVGKTALGILSGADLGYSNNYDNVVRMLFRSYSFPTGFFTESDLRSDLKRIPISALVKEIQQNIPKVK